MKIIKIMGGLGNQMFEWAFARAYSLINNCEILLDLSSFEKVKEASNSITQWNYELDKFCLKAKFANKKQVNSLKGSKVPTPRIIRNLFNIPKYKSLIVYEKKPQVFDAELLKNKKNVYFEGYFQTEKYFSAFRECLLEDFTLKTELDEKNKLMLKKIKSTNSISIHVRHGDYLNLKDIYKICSLDYYKNAINLIAKQIDKPHFYIFSDDTKWIKEEFDLKFPYTIVDINSPNEGYFDLELMKNCKHNITANSSFSWWGAWLNDNPSKIVITPKTWFVNNDNKYIDRVPNEWIKIEN